MSDRDWGSKPGSGGVLDSSQSNVDRRERLRQLAKETIDLAKDPYFMRNHLGSYECKLCLTLHNNEGNYLAHTQGKRHKTNLARRAAREAKDRQNMPSTPITTAFSQEKRNIVKRTVKIGTPGYRYIKQYDPDTNQRSLLFEIDYPEIADDTQPRHRIMSTFEQKKESVDKRYRYLLFAAEPYETICFKIPSWEIERDVEQHGFFTNWDRERTKFTMQITFKPRLKEEEEEEDSVVP